VHLAVRIAESLEQVLEVSFDFLRARQRISGPPCVSWAAPPTAEEKSGADCIPSAVGGAAGAVAILLPVMAEGMRARVVFGSARAR
jgi:hypothetical protein